jgi:hypothetical protein
MSDLEQTMAFSLYAATIPSYQQILGAASGLLGTAEAFFRARNCRETTPKLPQPRAYNWREGARLTRSG